MTGEFVRTSTFNVASQMEQLTEADYAAARRALEANPGLALDNYEKAVQGLARIHHRRGTSFFELWFGLRPPTSYPDECQVAYLRGEITTEEACERLRTFVDSEMLAIFFRELHEEIDRYGRARQAIADLVHKSSRTQSDEEAEKEADELINKLGAKSFLLKQHHEAIGTFISEARLEKGLSVLKLGEFTAPTASFLVYLVISRSRLAWEHCRRLAQKSQTQPEYLYSMTAAQLFTRVHERGLPFAQDLVTVLEQESAAARLYLRQCGGCWQVPSQAVEAGPSSKTSTLITVKRWSELAIGIDEHRRYWALTPAPAAGAPFNRGAAIELPLTSERWRAVLTALADAPDPRRIRRTDLERSLGLLPPRSVDVHQRYAAFEEGLESFERGATGGLNSVVKELRRNLRKLVDGPEDRGAFLSIGDEWVISGFMVRYLVQDEQGVLRFG